MVGSTLGKFILANFTGADFQREAYEACEKYALHTFRWNLAKGVPMPADMSWDLGPGQIDADDLAGKLKGWAKSIKMAELAMKRAAGTIAFAAGRHLIIFDQLPTFENAPVKRALQAKQPARHPLVGFFIGKFNA